MSNANLHRAKKAKNDEFYTRFEDVEKELAHYPHAFEGKTVYCNCDDPFKSAFVRYFRENFDRLKLKRLIATCFNGDAGKGETMFLFPRTDDRVAWHFEKTASSETCDRLQYNGDFRSEECVALLRQTDIVCTNPPFSLFGKFFATLIENGVDFIVLGHLTAILKRTVFPHLKSGRASVEGSEARRFICDGDEQSPIPTCWYATVKSDREKPFLNLTATYTADRYSRFDNYDAIEVSRVAEIPCDYEGVMGVPATFFASYNPSQFEIVGLCKKHSLPPATFNGKDNTQSYDPLLAGRHLWGRIFIKRKNFDTNSLKRRPEDFCDVVEVRSSKQKLDDAIYRRRQADKLEGF